MADGRMNRKPHLVVFAREPRIGRVKSRLGRGIGAVRATFWYRRQLAALLRRLGPPASWHCHLYITPDTARFAPHWPRGWTRRSQGSGDLGQRMRRALATAGRGPVVLIGSDIPAVRPALVRAAFRALGRAEVVVGPASDGGYWLIGVSGRRAPAPFGRVRWSSAHALDDTLAGFARGRRVARVAMLNDVDEAEDL